MSELGATMNLGSAAASPTETLWDLRSLLASAGVPTLQELSHEVQQNQDVDTAVMLTDRGLLLYTPVSGIEMVFPFTWQEFWVAITGLEREYIDRAERAGERNHPRGEDWQGS